MPAVSIARNIAPAIVMLAAWALFQPLRVLPGRRSRGFAGVLTAVAALISAMLLVAKLLVVAALWNKQPDLMVEPIDAAAILSVALMVCLTLILRTA